MTAATVELRDVSKFYGEVLGVNRVSLQFKPGLTGLVGPNGSGKSTLMHLITGLLRPTQGSISILGVGPDRPEELFRLVGYCTQYDSFPTGATGYRFLNHALALHGYTSADAKRRAAEVLDEVGPGDLVVVLGVTAVVDVDAIRHPANVWPMEGRYKTLGAQPPMYDISTFGIGSVASLRISE